MADESEDENVNTRDRFATEDEDTLTAMLDETYSKCTKRATDLAVKTFRSYLQEKKLDSEFENLPLCHLDQLLAKFFVEVRTVNGELYKRSSLCTLRKSLTRHLLSKNVDIMYGSDFMSSRAAFKTALNQLRKEGKWKVNYHPPIDESDLRKMYDYFDLQNNVKLQEKVYIDLMLWFGQRIRCEDINQLKIDDFATARNRDGKLYLYMTSDSKANGHTKNHHDTNAADACIYADPDDPKCPVKTYMKYKSHLNSNCDRLFQRPSEKHYALRWYHRVPSGHRFITRMMRSISKKANLSRSYNTKSLKATCVHIHDNKGHFSWRQILNVTGHRAELSFQGFAVLYTVLNFENVDRGASKVLTYAPNPNNIPVVMDKCSPVEENDVKPLINDSVAMETSCTQNETNDDTNNLGDEKQGNDKDKEEEHIESAGPGVSVKEEPLPSNEQVSLESEQEVGEGTQEVAEQRIVGKSESPAKIIEGSVKEEKEEVTGEIENKDDDSIVATDGGNVVDSQSADVVVKEEKTESKPQNEDDLLREQEGEQTQLSNHGDEDVNEDELLDDEKNMDDGSDDISEALVEDPSVNNDEQHKAKVVGSEDESQTDTEQAKVTLEGMADTEKAGGVDDRETVQEEVSQEGETEKDKMDIADEGSKAETEEMTESLDTDKKDTSAHEDDVVMETEDVTSPADVEMEEPTIEENKDEKGDDIEEKMDDVAMMDKEMEPMKDGVKDKEGTLEEGAKESNDGSEKPAAGGENKTEADGDTKQSSEEMETKDGDTEINAVAKDQAEKSSDDEIDESDIKIIDIKGDDEEKEDEETERSGGQETIDDGSLLNNDDSGEMCLQIASVSGAADIPDVINQEEEKKKSEEAEKPIDLDSTEKPIELDSAEKPIDLDSAEKDMDQDSAGKPTDSDSAGKPKDVNSAEKPIDLDTAEKPIDVEAEEKPKGKPAAVEPIDVEKAKPGPVLKKEEKQETKTETKPPASAAKPPSKAQTCIVCNKTGKCKYNIVRNGDIKHLCDDVCFKMFRSSPTSYLRGPDPTPPAQPTSEAKKPPMQPMSAGPEQYKTCSVCQLMNIKTSKPFLNWQGMDFCGEDCLGKFQGNLNASCSNCGAMVKAVAKGKYCLRFANEVKQFCSGRCYAEFKKRQKLCECCQKDISKSQDAFVAPVGKEGLFKDFCSQACLQKYEDKTNSDVEIIGVEKALKSKVLPKGNFSCAVCGKSAPVKHEINLEGKMNRLCSDPCFSAFQYANKLTMNTCDNCGVFCYNEGMTPQYIQFEGEQKSFCSYICVNQFKSTNKKTVNCAWCSSKKSNFDMIERVDANNKYQLFCSLNCLSLYRVNLQATSNQAVMCDECKKFVPAQYHLTMSDASVRNFCSYHCVMSFQSQFSGGKQVPWPQINTGQGPRSVSTRASTRVSAPAKQTSNPGALPVISNVVSLAQQGNQQQQINLKNNANVPVVVSTASQNIKNSSTQQTAQPVVKQQIIIQPPPPKVLKNKSLLCKPFVQTKATSCRPHTQTKETQTEGDWEPKKYFIPVPVPVYVPTPMAMYSQPTPVPFPIPVPIPVPCFIPTTKKSAESILKQIKEIQEKIPNDPLEAELLMMAEAVAGGEEDSDSDTELDAEPILPEPVKKVTTRSTAPPTSPPPLMTQSTGTDPPPAPQSGNEFGEDMLQMALRMASEMTEPVMDLESSIEPVPVNTDPPLLKQEEEEEEEEVYKVRETRSRRGSAKRSRGGNSGGGNRRSKRQKTSQNQVDTSMEDSIVSETAVEQEPAPDANMYLKFTYGINAWKHWVVHKNSQLEKVSKHGSGKLKLFKTDMLGCSADELNYSLCLFVKEVRKPNGEEYAPDSIFYLCLGIQQYLFENGRIDNIFTDMYYEKYTECLNEVLQRYEPKLNTAGQLVCRIEEEHLWESKQLGAHSPHVLLNTLVYFNTKYFMLKTAEDHMKLSFTHIMKHWKKSLPGRGNSSGRSVYLRYYCPLPTKPPNDPNLKKKKEELPVYEQAENLDNPLRCPVKLYEFYLSKCPESIKNRNDAFYLVPERSCVPDSPVWYSTQNLSIEAMNKMLNRLRLVREIQEAMLHTQPVYVS